MPYPRLSTFKTAAEFRSRLAALGLDLALDDVVDTTASAPFAQRYVRPHGSVGNRFCILPMEGWDGTEDGRPSDLTRRRWRNFGLSGAKLIWGGEAVAVRHDGRANPNQLVLTEANVASLAELRDVLLTAHCERYDSTDDLLIGLQLTHSGRFARPHSRRLEPQVVYRHPLLDRQFGVVDDCHVLSDDDIAHLINDFVQAARLARRLVSPSWT